MIPLLLLVGSQGLAAEEVTPLQKGEVAPFSGMLYPPQNAIRVSKKAEQCGFLLQEQERLRERAVIYEQALCEQKLDLDRDAAAKQRQILEQKPASFLVIALSYAAGVVTIVLAAWAMSEVSK